MNLQSVKIEKLFGQFDYDISLSQQDGITILTGPNGYGKTTILNIIYNFFQQNFFFFQKLNFGNIIFKFPEDTNIIVIKREQQIAEQVIQVIEGQPRIVQQPRLFVEIHLYLEISGKPIENYIFDFNTENRLFQILQGMFPFVQRTSQNIFVNTNTGNQMEAEDFLLKAPQKIIELLNGFPKSIDQIKQLFSVLSQGNVYLIKEQRLLKPLDAFEMINHPNVVKRSFSYTIQNYASELRYLIQQKQAEAFVEAQGLDNSFPSRLLQNSKKLSPDEFNKRFEKLTEKQQQLQQFGITVSNIQKVPEFNEGKADVLSVYLDDSETKTNFFTDLVTKINLFVTMINEKEFAHKKLMIDGTSGFYFVTENGEKLDLSNLSSGEQEEVVVLYDLLFKTPDNALVLIDEPEISLHVSWQKAFVSDLISVLKIRKISFLVATHSPQVINSHWDMVTDLYKLSKGEEYIKND